MTGSRSTPSAAPARCARPPWKPTWGVRHRRRSERACDTNVRLGTSAHGTSMLVRWCIVEHGHTQGGGHPQLVQSALPLWPAWAVHAGCRVRNRFHSHDATTRLDPSSPTPTTASSSNRLHHPSGGNRYHGEELWKAAAWAAGRLIDAVRAGEDADCLWEARQTPAAEETSCRTTLEPSQ